MKKNMAEKMVLIRKILNRAQEMNLLTDRMSSFMDLDFANLDIPMNFQGMLNADDFNFQHDFIGIRNNMNRKTRVLDNHFIPRFAEKAPKFKKVEKAERV